MCGGCHQQIGEDEPEAGNDGEPEPRFADQLRGGVELFAQQEARASGEDIVPHQRLVVVEFEALEEAHGDEDAGREQYGKNQINHCCRGGPVCPPLLIIQQKYTDFAYLCRMKGFNLQKTKRHFTEVLAEKFPKREAEQLMRILLEDLFGIDWNQQLMNPDLRIDELQHHQLCKAVERLLSGEPVQYVTGVARFCDLIIKVTPSVLIPRPETEELVQKICTVSLPCHSNVESAAMSFQRGYVRERESMAAVSLAGSTKPLRIWDIGTGSGCISIALAKHFVNAEVIAFDISEEALQIAKENAENNGVNVTFVHDDVLHPTSDFFNQPVDLVVSNPPYVCDSERASMEANVLDWEPENALFVPDADPLLFYRQILRLAKKQLNPNGQVWFEINERMGEEMLRLCREMGFAETATLLDFAGKVRFCCAR